MSKIRFAVLGSGGRWMSVDNVYPQHPDVEFVALCDNATGMVEEAAAHYKQSMGKDIAIYHSYEELIKNASYDAIIIDMDPDQQADYAVAEMERGIHVQTEVPAAWTIDQCWKLVRAVEKTGCKYQLAEQARYWNFIRIWREMAARGEFGKIIYAEAEYLHYEPRWDWFQNVETRRRIWTDDPSYYDDPNYTYTWRGRCFENPIWYLPHSLSPLLSITGGRIERVSCQGTRAGSYASKGFRARDIECALMYNSDDIVFSLRAGFSSPYGHKKETGAHWYQIKGSEKSVEWARTDLEEDCGKSYSLETDWVRHPEWGCPDPDAPEEFRRALHGGTDYYPMYYFVDAIKSDKQPPMDVYKAVECAAPAVLAMESAQKGGELLTVPDFRSGK
ncbi:MAG: Gfo/Idh/MocA family oxidoreductase [Abditibacteriota bacterium]|nr:Gfo/Idh/MocA family oxidoreductase [Abditibacteriota bacterium]